MITENVSGLTRVYTIGYIDREGKYKTLEFEVDFWQSDLGRLEQKWIEYCLDNGLNECALRSVELTKAYLE